MIARYDVIPVLQQEPSVELEDQYIGVLEPIIVPRPLVSAAPVPTLVERPMITFPHAGPIIAPRPLIIEQPIVVMPVVEEEIPD